MNRLIKSINVMVLGQSGTGKSTLINYLFSENVCDSGVGMPVTGKDFQKVVFELADIKVPFHIYDSWGLESNKALEWKEIIDEKIENINYSRETGNTASNENDFIHGILYCLSLKSDRIQDFDLEMIDYLSSKGLIVLIVFTNSNIADLDNKNEIFTDQIYNRYSGDKRDLQIVNVNSRIQRKIGQKTDDETFGRIEVLSYLSFDVLNNYLIIALRKWQSSSLKELGDLKRKLERKVDIFYYEFKDRFKSKVRVGSEIKDEISKYYSDYIEEIQRDLNTVIKNYVFLKNKIYLLLNSEPVTLGGSNTMYTSFADGSVEAIVASAMMKVIPVFGQIYAIMEKGFIKDELKGIIKNWHSELETQITGLHDEWLKKLQEDTSLLPMPVNA